MTLANFVGMGGYGGYVWSAYGIAAVVLLGNLAISHWQFKQIFRCKMVSQRTKRIAFIEMNEES